MDPQHQFYDNAPQGQTAPGSGEPGPYATQSAQSSLEDESAAGAPNNNGAYQHPAAGPFGDGGGGTSFQDAIEKAKQIAAKFTAAVTSGDQAAIDATLKRPLDDDAAGGSKRRKIYIPVQQNPDVNYMGLLIGPGGKTNKEMQDKSGARILIRGRGANKDPSKPQADDDEELHVLIEAGNDEQLNVAAEMVNAVVFGTEESRNQMKQEQLQHLSAINGQQQPPTMPAPATSMSYTAPSGGGGGLESAQVQVPNNKVGTLIGKGGETIKEVQARSGCNIQITKDAEHDPSQPTRTVFLTGSAEQIAAAKAIIMDKTSDNPTPAPQPVATSYPQQMMAQCAPTPAASTGYYGVTPAMPAMGSGGGTTTETMQIPNSKVGLVIGKGGETIRELQSKSGANIQVTRDAEHDPNNPTRSVNITGEHAAVMYAKQMIQDTLNEGPPAATPAVPTADPNAMELGVPDTLVGLIIGKQGQTINELQQWSGARIQIARECRPGETNRPVTVSGHIQAVQYAKQLIEQKVAEQPGHTAASVAINSGHHLAGAAAVPGVPAAPQPAAYPGYDPNAHAHYNHYYQQPAYYPPPQPGGYDYSQYYQHYYPPQAYDPNQYYQHYYGQQPAAADPNAAAAAQQQQAAQPMQQPQPMQHPPQQPIPQMPPQMPAYQPPPQQ